MKTKDISKADIAFLRSVLEYRDGRLFWTARIDRRGRTSPGKQAGSFHKSTGYMTVSVGRRNWGIHRVVWLLHHDSLPDQIDHINGDPTDNRIENLRIASVGDNARNRRGRRNSSGHIGVCWNKAISKWQAQIKFKGRSLYLGLFERLEDAVETRRKAADELGFHPNHGRTA